MEDTTTAGAFTAAAANCSSQSANDNETAADVLKDADNMDDDCNGQDLQRPRIHYGTGAGNARWCTRSRSSTSFLIHNLLISCSGGGGDDTPAIASSPPQLAPVERYNNDENGYTSASTASCSESNKSRSRSPTPRRSSAATDVCGGKGDGRDDDDDNDDDDRDDRDDGGQMYAADLYRIKKRKCAVPFRRMTTTAKRKNVVGANGRDDDDNRYNESESLTFKNLFEYG